MFRLLFFQRYLMRLNMVLFPFVNSFGSSQLASFWLENSFRNYVLLLLICSVHRVVKLQNLNRRHILKARVCESLQETWLAQQSKESSLVRCS